MALNRNRVIAKPKSRNCISPSFDLLRSLPSDLCASIIDQLRESDLRRVPLVCKSWNSLFSPSSPLEPSFRHFVRRRFGHQPRPTNTGQSCWGQLYLHLRRERCHLCPERNIAPFVYAGSSTLAIMFNPHSDSSEEGLALFPVCSKCFNSLMRPPRQVFIPVVESSAVPTVFPALKDRAHDVKPGTGYIYTDIPTGVRCGRGISYHPARPLAELCASLPSVSSQEDPAEESE